MLKEMENSEKLLFSNSTRFLKCAIYLKKERKGISVYPNGSPLFLYTKMTTD